MPSCFFCILVRSIRGEQHFKLHCHVIWFTVVHNLRAIEATAWLSDTERNWTTKWERHIKWLSIELNWLVRLLSRNLSCPRRNGTPNGKHQIGYGDVAQAHVRSFWCNIGNRWVRTDKTAQKPTDCQPIYLLFRRFYPTIIIETWPIRNSICVSFVAHGMAPVSKMKSLQM